MTNTFLIALALSGLMSGQSGIAPQAAPEAAPQSAPAAAPEATTIAGTKHASETVRTNDADEKVICRNERKVGSNMITRVCKSGAQRKADAQQARDAMQSGSRGINSLGD